MINFKTQKEPKMKLFDFGAFQKNMQMLSHDKIIFHMLFEAFHDTPRNPTIFLIPKYLKMFNLTAHLFSKYLGILTVVVNKIT